MATSIASQLQSLQSHLQIQSEPLKRPFTRPSILFDPKEAADIDVETIFNTALSGLEILVTTDQRFSNYKNDLFSHKSRELDRELMGIDENKRIDLSIGSYLRLLSGHLHSPASLKTLEYLIRRYKIHVYNIDELILCALPYHDTHAFVRIVQLIDTGNSKWKFLGGVKDKGAPAPRSLIVQQCIRDRGILEVLCNYGSPSKRSQPTIPVISFCTAVIVEVVGSVTTIDSDVVKRVLPFVSTALKPDSKVCSDHKAGALMIVGLLANKVALSPKLVKSLIRSVAEVAQEDAKESTDLQWLRTSVMTLINLVQFQSADILPKKALDVLKEIRDFAGILSGLCKEFNIDKFISVLLDSLVEYSSSDNLCRLALVSIIETVPVKDAVETLVSKVLMSCMKLSQRSSNLSSPESGTWAKDILVAVNKIYPSELRVAVRKFLENCKVQPKKGESTFEILCKTLDGNIDFTNGISDSKIWFALNHPKAEVRRATLSGLNSSGILKTKAVDSQRLVTVQDAMLRQLYDDDLTVVKMALSLDGLSELISTNDLLEALHNVLQRCVSILMSKSLDDTTLAGDVIVSCLARMTSSFSAQIEYSRKLATLIFPLLIILPKTHRLNLKVLLLARQLKWPFFHNIDGASDSALNLQPEGISALNMENINSMADILLMHPEDHVPWIIQSCKEFKLSKTIFFMILMQSFQRPKFTSCHLKGFYEAFFPILATEWNAIESGDFYVEFNKEMLHWDFTRFEDQLVDTNLEALNANIQICLFWRLLEAFSAQATADVLLGDNGFLMRELFVFFASSKLSNAFKEHLHYLVEKCSSSPACFLSSFFAEEGNPVDVQVESLHCYAHLCSQSDDKVLGQLIAKFPSILVPLASDDQETRSAAMTCIEGLYALQKRNISCKRNGGNAVQIDFLYDLMDLMIQQKCLILSDRKFLPSLLTSSLSSSSHSLMVHTDINQRFDQSKKTEIRDFILDSVPELSAYGKFVILSLLRGLGNAIIRNDIDSLLNILLERRSKYLNEQDKSVHKLSRIEVKILCLLLEICATPPSPADRCVLEVHLLKALQLDGLSQEDPAVVQPCISVLQVLNCQLYSGLKTDIQELLFRELVSLFHNANGGIQNASRETLMRLNITSSTVVQTLDYVYTCGSQALLSTHAKKKRKSKSTEHKKSSLHHDVVCRKENTFSFISSLVDILLLKKNIVNRDSLVGPLFELLGKLLSDQLGLRSSVLEENSMQPSSTISQPTSTSVYYIEQTLLLILEDICTSLQNNIPIKDDLVNSFNVKMLVECARSTTEGVTRNHVFALLSSIAKVMPEKIVDHILEILTVAGESAVTQIDGHSERVFEGLVSAIIPCWLSKRDSTDELLQVFIHILPEVAEHRRLSIVRYLLRTLGEQRNLASVHALLFHSLVLRSGVFSDDARAQGSDGFRSLMEREWEYVFAQQICDQYSCMIWLSSLVTLLQRMGAGELSEKSCTEMLLSFQLITQKLQDPEFAFKLKSGDDSEKIQMTLEELMEQVVSLSLIVDAKRKKIPVATRKYLKEVMYVVLRTITMDMIPSAYFESIIRLLEHADREMQKKALRLLSETMKRHDTPPKNKAKRSSLHSSGRWLNVDDKALQSLEKLCVQIVQIVDDSTDDLNTSLKLGAVSALDVLAQRFPSNYSIFSISLTSVVRSIMSHDFALSSSCLKTTGTLINVIGARALAELPHIMKNVLKRSHDVSSTLKSDAPGIKKAMDPSSTSKESFMLSVLSTLEAVVDKLGGFLNPYLGDIIELVVLCPEYTSESDPKLKLRADTVRRLISEKIPVRLSLPSLLKVYPSAVKSGDSSLGIAFEMLTSLIGAMDKASVSGYHAQIFDMCLLALDLRRLHPASVQNIDVVERSVLNAIVTLTMKLTESMFRPLFVKTIEWAESDVEEKGSTNIDRAISFYGLVNKLVEKHRSLFVPYFKHLVEGCVRYLADTEMAKSALRRKKKAKIEKESGKGKEDSALLIGDWQLRALILSSLHSCFLYDTGSLKFLDSTNFQALLKPIVSQLVAEPPSSLKEHSHIPSEEEVDDLLVSCIGQMAVTAGSDLLWKPLNHEVLMQTRSERSRCRILGLRIIKYLVEHLKEEYLVLLPETIPFLGELLEDLEQPVKSLAQDILRDMESMSGESLAQYL